MKNLFNPKNLCARRAEHREASREDGYALMMVIFFTALLLIATMVAAPRILQEGKREKEKEMIWRGHQYVRGVKLYYRKMGRFPTSIEDLTKPKVGSLRFMRQAYKDPMNAEDGSWRLIYVGPAGQLIGSLKPPQNLQLPRSGAGMGTPASTMASNSSGQASGSSAFGSSSGFGSFGSSAANSSSSPGAALGSAAPGAASPTGGGSSAQPGAQQGGDPNAQANAQGGAPNSGQPGQPGQPSQPGATTSADGSQPASTDASGDAMSTPQDVVPTSTAPIIGGNIIGVGSKISAPSVIIYEKAKNYHLFEFIWDPSKDTTIAGQPPIQTGTGLGQNIGTNPGAFGQPGATTPNPSQATPGTAGTPSPAPPLDSGPPPQQ